MITLNLDKARLLNERKGNPLFGSVFGSRDCLFSGDLYYEEALVSEETKYRFITQSERKKLERTLLRKA